MSNDATRDRSQLDARVLAWMREWDEQARPADGESTDEDEERFDSLARDLFAFQISHCPAYARLCEARGQATAPVAHWSEIPTVPTAAFKELTLRCFPADRVVKTFRTSGTTSTRRGEHPLDTLALYEASLLPTLRHYLFPDLRGTRRANLQILAPSPSEAPDSSLSHMFGCALDALGSPSSTFAIRDGGLHGDPLIAALLRACETAEPVALCGTAFAFVHLLDAMDEAGLRFSLPTGSRLMETGGFKGRSREIPQAELYIALTTRLGIPEERIINQYGMTELGSQFYDSLLACPGPRRKRGPPWTRVRIVDPETGTDVAHGETGILVIHDLANVGSVAAIETADLGRHIADGFEVLGREPDAESRGCSIAADALLAESS